MVKESQVVVHEAYEPDVLADFPNADPLTGKHVTEIDPAPADADASTGSIHASVEPPHHQGPTPNVSIRAVRAQPTPPTDPVSGF